MAYDKQKVIDIALAEVDYLEKASNSQLDSKTGNAGKKNYTKYSRDLTNMEFYNGYKQGAEWCDIFVDWCMVQAYGKEAALAITFHPTNNKINYGAGCKYSRDYYKAKGRLFSDPQPGDQIFYYGMTDGKVDKTKIAHTGLVYKVDNSKVYTVEGNTSGASGVVANGGGVAKKSYSLSYRRIAGYGRPDWGDLVSALQGIIPNTIELVYTVKSGDSLWKIAQNKLGNGKRYKEIMTLNGLKSETIHKGDVLKLPVSGGTVIEETEIPAKEEYTTYTVKKGDSLWAIAQKKLGNGNRYKEIMTLNGLKNATISTGKKLKIPNG